MQSNKKRVLIVDDDANLLDAVRRVLHRDFDVVTANSGFQALELINTTEVFGVIVSDFQMPEMDGVAFLREATKVSPDSIPVMLTGHADLDVAMAALHEARIYRFLVKPCPHHILKATLIDCLEQHRLIIEKKKLVAELKEANAVLSQRNQELVDLSRSLADLNVQLDRLARVDGLTGILNRRAWMEGASLGLELAKRQRMVYGITLLDVDEFKCYNDTFGHQAGDDCLVRVARCIQDTCRASDLCGRYGGEEFVLACLHEELSGVARHAERVRAAVYDLGIVHPCGTPVTVSIGCVAAIDDSDTWELLVKRADEALYAAKHDGRNCVRQWSPSTNALVQQQ